MSTINHDAVLFRKLQQDAEKTEREKREEGDEKGAEYFRGVAAGFKCAAFLLEERSTLNENHSHSRKG